MDQGWHKEDGTQGESSQNIFPKTEIWQRAESIKIGTRVILPQKKKPKNLKIVLKHLKVV